MSSKNSDAVCKSSVDNCLNDPNIIWNTTLVNFNERNHDNVRFVKGKSKPAVREDRTPNFYVDEAILHSVNESPLLRLDPNEKLKLDEQEFMILSSTLTSPKTKKEIPTNSYVDSLHESSRNKRELSSVFNDHYIELKKSTNSDSVSVREARNQITNWQTKSLLMSQ